MLHAAEGGSLSDWFAELSNHVVIKKTEAIPFIYLRQWKAVYAWKTAESLQAYVDFNLAGASDLEGFISKDE